MTGSVDKERTTDVIYLDVFKDFGMVPHDILAVKVERCGFHGLTFHGWVAT